MEIRLGPHIEPVIVLSEHWSICGAAVSGDCPPPLLPAIKGPEYYVRPILCFWMLWVKAPLSLLTGSLSSCWFPLPEPLLASQELSRKLRMRVYRSVCSSIA